MSRVRCGNCGTYYERSFFSTGCQVCKDRRSQAAYAAEAAHQAQAQTELLAHVAESSERGAQAQLLQAEYAKMRLSAEIARQSAYDQAAASLHGLLLEARALAADHAHDPLAAFLRIRLAAKKAELLTPEQVDPGQRRDLVELKSAVRDLLPSTARAAAADGERLLEWVSLTRERSAIARTLAESGQALASARHRRGVPVGVPATHAEALRQVERARAAHEAWSADVPPALTGQELRRYDVMRLRLSSDSNGRIVIDGIGVQGDVYRAQEPGLRGYLRIMQVARDGLLRHLTPREDSVVTVLILAAIASVGTLAPLLAVCWHFRGRWETSLCNAGWYRELWLGEVESAQTEAVHTGQFSDLLAWAEQWLAAPDTGGTITACRTRWPGLEPLVTELATWNEDIVKDTPAPGTSRLRQAPAAVAP